MEDNYGVSLDRLRQRGAGAPECAREQPMDLLGRLDTHSATP